jgi:DNA-binding MarR family transcriptional regulator
MNGVDLYVLARRLLKLGEAAIPGAGIHRLPTSIQLVLMDVSEHPDSSISEIVDRVGFPQSLVSGAVKRLELGGALVTRIDPRDRRRTLVRVAPDVRAKARKVEGRPLTDVVGEVLGTDDPSEIDDVLDMLTRLAERFEAASSPPAAAEGP